MMNLRLVDACRKLSPEQLDTTATGTHGSIAATSRLGALFLALLLLTVACGGGPSGEENTTSLTGSDATTTTVTSATTTTTASTAPAAGSGLPITAPGDFAGTFRGVLRVSFDSDAGTALSTTGNSVFSNGDFECETSFSYAGLTGSEKVIVTTAGAWLDEGDGFEAATRSRLDLSMCVGAPEFWEADPFEGLDLGSGEAEILNGISTNRFDLTSDSIAYLELFGGSDLENIDLNRFTVWVAEPDGWLAAMDFDASVELVEGLVSPNQEGEDSGTYSIFMEISDVDDRMLVVEAPALAPPSIETAHVDVSGETLPPMPDGGSDPAVGLMMPELTGVSFDGSTVSINNDGRAKAIFFLAHW